VIAGVTYVYANPVGNEAGRAIYDGGVMIDLSLLRGVRVDPKARRARAGGGATWGDFDAEIAAVVEANPDAVVIIGDAAHTIHPLAGQGANLGIQDALVLAEVLTELESQQANIGLLRHLRPFERERKTEAMKMIAAMEGFKQLFAGDDPIKKLVRGIGLTAADKLPGIKHQFVAQAMGL